MKKNEVLLGLIAGFAIGGIVGILFAPKKGAKLRRKMFAKGEEMTEAWKSKYGDVMNNVSDSIEQAQKEIEDKIALGKSKWSHVKDEFIKSNI